MFYIRFIPLYVRYIIEILRYRKSHKTKQAQKDGIIEELYCGVIMLNSSSTIQFILYLESQRAMYFRENRIYSHTKIHLTSSKTFTPSIFPVFGTTPIAFGSRFSISIASTEPICFGRIVTPAKAFDIQCALKSLY